MIQTGIEEALSYCKSRYSEKIGGLDPLVRSFAEKPTFFLSSLLIGIVDFYRAELNDNVIWGCQAIELLDQALIVGRLSSTDSSQNEERLLAADYLYAQAIKETVKIKKPEVVQILSVVIMRSAESRMLSADTGRARLISAVFDIAAIVGSLTTSQVDELMPARQACVTKAKVDWMDLLPTSFDRQTLERCS